MKRWRVVHFATPDEAEGYLNGLSIEPDQIKGIFANPPGSNGSGSVLLVCWLSAHQQRVEQLQQQPRTDEDRIAEAELGQPRMLRPPRVSRRRAEPDEEPASPDR